MKKKINNEYVENQDIDNLIGKDETVIWKGKPKKNAFIANKILGMLPFILLWICFDGAFIAIICLNFDKIPLPGVIGLIVFFAFHLIPVWIWLSKIIFANREYKLTEYAVTDKRVLIKNGIIASNYRSFYYHEIKEINLHIGLVDRITHVGDILITTGNNEVAYYVNNQPKYKPEGILDIENPYEVYKILEKTIRDISTDVMFPNALRPDTNEGYKTKYKPDSKK